MSRRPRANSRRWTHGREIEIQPTDQIGYLALLRVLFRHYPSRSVLGAALMITQSFLYNAIFFTYGLVLEFFFHVKTTDTAYYFMAFAVGNLLGPLTLGRLFDTIGRRKMISGTYILSGVLLAISAELFRVGSLNATTQTICWTVVFFFASAGASAGYLTVSEIFPLEVRAKAIAVFFAIAQCFGAFGSHWYGHLIGNGNDRNSLFIGYLVGAGAMIARRRDRDLLRRRRRGQVPRGRGKAAVGHRQAARGDLPRRRPRNRGGLEPHPVVVALVVRVPGGEVRDLGALDRQIRGAAQRPEC